MVVRPFTSDVADLLNGNRADEEISNIGLGKYNLSIAFDGKLPVINAQSKAMLSISGAEYEWSGKPIAAPVWELVGQRVESFELRSDMVLRLRLTSGDWVDFHTDEAPYEAVILDFGRQNDALVMEIF